MGLTLDLGKIRRKLKESILPVTFLLGALILGGDTLHRYQPPAPDPLAEKVDSFPAGQFLQMKESLDGKKLALAIISTDDPNGATRGLEDMFQENFTGIPGYRLYTARVSGFYDLFNQLRDYSLLKPIDALILAGHGRKDRIEINPDESITTSNAKELFAGYSSLLSKDAIVILYSCSSGKGEGSVADAISDALDRDVMAPRYTVIPETDIPPGERKGEFGTDSGGRPAFRCDTFRYYRNITFHEWGYSSALAASSYAQSNPDQASERDCGSYFRFIDRQAQ
jgi:hypothetical protein